MQGDLFGTLLPWLGGLLVLAILGGLLMVWTRRMAVGRGDARRPSDGFGMDGLRGMLDRGELTPEQYDRARRRLVQRVRDSASSDDPADPSGKVR